MNIVLLVPRRRDNGHRDLLWTWARARWERHFPEIPIFEGHHNDGPFSRSAAINTAASAAGAWDYGIVIDSDIFIRTSQVRKAIATAKKTGRVTWAHRRWRGLSEDATERVVKSRVDFGPEYEGHDMDLVVERTNPLSWSCCVVIPRPVWDGMGGFDERFRGWGFEDMAFQSVVCGLYGHERIEGDVYHLWHPRSEERIVRGESRITATPEYVTNARLGRRYMVALRRDHQLTDRPTSSDAAELQRDITNLKHDDAQYGIVVRRHKLPDWDRWWPTLEELVEGSKVARELGQLQAVTLIMRTGGEPGTWPQRSDYLQRSLASLNERVSGPIIQRVIYSDWGASFTAKLTAIAEAHGFYVVGPDRHVGYAESRRLLWAYLDRRAKGEFVFSVEDDFTYDRDVDLAPMIETLREQPHLRQLALLRAAAYPREFEAGGVLQSLKTPVTLRNHRPHPFMEHRDHWTDNPALYSRDIVRTPWPRGENTERRFGDALLKDKLAAFAYWGEGDPWITHIGAVRAGTTY